LVSPYFVRFLFSSQYIGATYCSHVPFKNMFSTNSIYFIHNRNLNTMWNVIKKTTWELAMDIVVLGKNESSIVCLLTKFTLDFVKLFKIQEQDLKISPNF
jgi:hypothetical protein